nr:MAG TPA: hypothetical protein [Caudoviricetes sp.]
MAQATNASVMIVVLPDRTEPSHTRARSSDSVNPNMAFCFRESCLSCIAVALYCRNQSRKRSRITAPFLAGIPSKITTQTKFCAVCPVFVIKARFRVFFTSGLCSRNRVREFWPCLIIQQRLSSRKSKCQREPRNRRRLCVNDNWYAVLISHSTTVIADKRLTLTLFEVSVNRLLHRAYAFPFSWRSCWHTLTSNPNNLFLFPCIFNTVAILIPHQRRFFLLFCVECVKHLCNIFDSVAILFVQMGFEFRDEPHIDFHEPIYFVGGIRYLVDNVLVVVVHSPSPSCISLSTRTNLRKYSRFYPPMRPSGNSQTWVTQLFRRHTALRLFISRTLFLRINCPPLWPQLVCT